MNGPLAQTGFRHFDRTELEQSLGQRFASQVARVPGNTAIHTINGRLTYTELDRLSNRIAHMLSCGPESIVSKRVVLCIDDEINLIATILAVLKLGGVYVPLDPQLSAPIMAEILADVDAQVIVADESRFAFVAPMVTDGVVTNLTIELPTHTHDVAVSVEVEPDAFAYIYYTSGTTGSPKGVVDSHRNVLHNVMRYTNNLGIGDRDRLTLLQSCGFSGAVSNIFSALLNGATLLPFDVRRHGVARLVAWLDTAGATIYHSVPSLFRHVVRHHAKLSSIRVVRLEGDKATHEDVSLFQQRFGVDCVLANGLGATETGLSRQFFIRHDTFIPGTSVPVGFATTDMVAELVDELGNDVRDGEIGEIVVRSRYLACGYWRQPELTAQAFKTTGNGERRYFSGDLGRLHDGSLEICGRKDSRMKVHGHWIDVAAVEAALNERDDIHGAIVLPTENRLGVISMVAFVIGSAHLDHAALRERVESTLGLNSVPVSITVVDDWPVDRNGKVDARALLELYRNQHDGSVVGPSTSTERCVAEVFSTVLGVTELSVEADFYALGGDSLSAVEVASKLNERFCSETPMATFQHDPTVRAIAAAIDHDSHADCLVALQPHGDKPTFFCVHAHMGHVFNLRELARSFTDRPVYCLQARGFDGKQPPATQITEMACDYVHAIRQRQANGPYVIGGYCFGGLVAVEMARQLALAGHKVQHLVLIDTDCPANLHISNNSLANRIASLIDIRTAGANLCHRVTALLSDAVIRVARPLWRYGVARRWPLPRATVRPEFAIRMLCCGYKAKPYSGRSLVIETANKPVEQGWPGYLSDAVRVTRINADAKSLMRKPHVAELAAIVHSEFEFGDTIPTIGLGMDQPAS